MLSDTLESIGRQNTTQELLIGSEKEARYHLFNFYSCAYCIRQTMYEGKHFSKGADEFDRIVTDWKNELIPRIAMAIRQKYQHGSLMEHVLHYEYRTAAHPKGEGFSVGYNLEPATWVKVLDEIKGAEAKQHLNSILAMNRIDPLTKINGEFIESCERVAIKLQELFNRSFADDLSKKQELKNEYDDIEKWFQDRGMYSI